MYIPTCLCISSLVRQVSCAYLLLCRTALVQNARTPSTILCGIARVQIRPCAGPLRVGPRRAPPRRPPPPALGAPWRASRPSSGLALPARPGAACRRWRAAPRPGRGPDPAVLPRLVGASPPGEPFLAPAFGRVERRGGRAPGLPPGTLQTRSRAHPNRPPAYRIPEVLSRSPGANRRGRGGVCVPRARAKEAHRSLQSRLCA
jgi:hypothetical protein